MYYRLLIILLFLKHNDYNERIISLSMKDQRALHRFHFKCYYMQNKLKANVRFFVFFYLRCKLRFDAKEVASFLVI